MSLLQDQRIIAPPPKGGRRGLIGRTNRVIESLRSVTTKHMSPMRYKPGGTDTETRRFKVVQSGANSVLVYEGDWTRNGYTVSLTVDAGKTYKTLSGISNASETYYIYIVLSSGSSRDPALYPDTLTAVAATSAQWAAITDRWGNIYKLLRVVTTDGAGNISSLSAPYWLNDIDDEANIGDANSNNSGTAPYRKTIERNPTADIHQYEDQLYNIDTVGSDDAVAVVYKSGSGTTGGELIYPVIDADEGGYDTGGQKSIETRSGTYLQIYNMDNQGDDSMDTNSRVFVRENTGPVVVQVTASTLANWLVDLGDLAGALNTAAELEHTKLVDLGDNDDHHTQGTYWYMLLGNPDGDTKANMYDRNQDAGPNDNYLGQALHIETNLHVDAGYIYHGDATLMLDLSGNPVLMKDADWKVEATTDITPGSLTGSFQAAGGITAGDRIQALDTTASSSATTGCGIFYGGIGVAGNSYIGAVLEVNDGTCHGLLAGTDAVLAGGHFGYGGYEVWWARVADCGYMSGGSATVKYCDGNYAIDAGGGSGTSGINTDYRYFVNGTQVITSQQADIGVIADTSGTDSDGVARAKCNEIRGVLQTHGLMA